MPYKSAKQANLMRAVAHGWKPDRIEGPTQAAARKFVKHSDAPTRQRRQARALRKTSASNTGGGSIGTSA